MRELFEYKKTILFMFIVFITLLISGFSYAYFIISVHQDDSHVGLSDCFKLDFIDNNKISLADAIPLTESEANDLVPYTFTIENICNQAATYDVTIEELNTSNMDLNAIRYKLDNNESTILGSITSNLSTISNDARASFTIDSSILMPSETRTYNLKLWIDINSTADQAAEKVFDSKVVIVSTMEKNPYYIITLNKNNGEAISDTNIVKGRDISSITPPSKTGYSFVSWCSDSNLTNELSSNYIPLGNQQLYAKYSANSYTVTLNNQSADVSGSTFISATYDSSMPSIILPEKDGYKFMGYYSEENGGGTLYYNANGTSVNNYNFANDITLYANWTQITASEITYSHSGSSCTNVECALNELKNYFY